VLHAATLSRQDWDIHTTVMQTTFQRVIESKILQESLWTTHSGSVIPLTTRTSTDPELQAAFAPFCAARRRPISHFPALNTHSLWETRTSRVACLFSTIPCAKWNGWVGGGPVNQCLEVKWSELKPGLRLQPRPSFQCQWARGGSIPWPDCVTVFRDGKP
jgi:hypothetical protein